MRAIDMSGEVSLSIVIISSPAASNPGLELLEAVINSFGHVDGLAHADIFIVLDGYRIALNEAHTKRGRVTEAMATAYEQYHANLLNKYEAYSDTPVSVSERGGSGIDDSGSRRVFVKKSEVHLGFANAVKLGLTICKTKYCLICQHDRMFIRPFGHLDKCIQAMEEHPHIRYIGWPSTTNCCHEQQVKYRYGLDCLTSMPQSQPSPSTESVMKGTECVGNGTYLKDNAAAVQDGCMQIPLTYIPSDDPSNPDHVVDCKLQPLIFWFDSQHLCCVERYLEIFKPYIYMPKSLQEREGAKGIARFKLRSGDFIEDRFGQAQRTVLCKYKHDVEFVKELFQWFGCYLVWKLDFNEEEAVAIPHHPKANEAQRGNPVYLTRRNFNGPLGKSSSNPSTHIYYHSLPFVTHIRGRQYDEEEIQIKLQRMEPFAPSAVPLQEHEQNCCTNCV